MLPTSKEWLVFLETLPHETEIEPPKSPLEYDALLNVTQNNFKITIVHQQQQQQRQEQQQQQQQQFINEDIENNKERIRRAKELLAKEKSNRLEHSDDSEILPIPGVLTSKKPEEQLKFIENNYKELTAWINEKLNWDPKATHTQQKIKEHDAQIIKILFTLDKIQSSFTKEPSNISKAALNKIIDNVAYFVDGIALNNLPAGFFLAEKAIKFDAQAWQESLAKPTDGYTQPVVLPNKIALIEKEQFNPINANEIMARLGTLSHESNLPALEDHILAELGFTNANIASLTATLKSENGTLKVYALLNTLKKLHTTDPELYQNIKECFVDPAENLSAIANLTTLNHLQKISKFTPAKKEWWCNLTKQHTSKSGIGKTDLNDLYSTFDAFYNDLNSFWHEVYGSDFELPYPCPLTAINNMQVALNRVAYLIKHAAYPKDQLQSLKNLNLQTAHKAGEDRGQNHPPLRLVKPEMFERLLDKNEIKQDFLRDLYTEVPGETIYFPSYATAEKLLTPLAEKIDEYFHTPGSVFTNEPLSGFAGAIKGTAIKLVVNMIQQEAQAKDVFQCLDKILLYLKQNALSLPPDKLPIIPMLLMKYPLFRNQENLWQPNPQYFELALKNPTVAPDIFYAIEQPFQNKKQPSEQQAKGDLLTCLPIYKISK